MDTREFSEMLKRSERYRLLQHQRETEDKPGEFSALWKKNKYAQNVYSQIRRKMRSWEKFVLPKLEVMAKAYWGEDQTIEYMRPDEEELKEEVFKSVSSSYNQLISLLWQVTGPPIDFGLHRAWPIFLVIVHVETTPEIPQKLHLNYFFETISSYGIMGTFVRLRDLEKAMIKAFNEGPYWLDPYRCVEI